MNVPTVLHCESNHKQFFQYNSTKEDRTIVYKSKIERYIELNSIKIKNYNVRPANFFLVTTCGAASGSTYEGELNLVKQIQNKELQSTPLCCLNPIEIERQRDISEMYIKTNETMKYRDLKRTGEFFEKKPQFLPFDKSEHREKLALYLQSKDMLNREKIVKTPEFYVGNLIY